MTDSYSIDQIDVGVELETYINEYQRVVWELTEEGTEIPARYTDERRTIKRFAMEEAAMIAPYAALWIQEKQAALEDGRYTNETEGEEYGHWLISRFGSIWQALESKSARAKHEDDNREREDAHQKDLIASILEHSACENEDLARQYQHLADTNDVIPGDDVVAQLGDCTVAEVKDARRSARQLGYAFSRVAPGEIGETVSNYGWWCVTERPSEEALARARLAAMDKEALLSLLYEWLE